MSAEVKRELFFSHLHQSHQSAAGAASIGDCHGSNNNTIRNDGHQYTSPFLTTAHSL